MCVCVWFSNTISYFSGHHISKDVLLFWRYDDYNDDIHNYASNSQKKLCHYVDPKLKKAHYIFSVFHKNRSFVVMLLAGYWFCSQKLFKSFLHFFTTFKVLLRWKNGKMKSRYTKHQSSSFSFSQQSSVLLFNITEWVYIWHDFVIIFCKVWL